MNRRSLLTAGAVLAAAPALAQADYPNRPIRLFVGFPPGGGVDLTARPLLPHLQPRLGQPVVVENRPGANGNLAVEAACKAPADGYTLLVGNTGPMAANHALYRSLPFDTQRDLTPVAQLISTPLVLVVPPGLGVNSLPELLAMARARPGALNMGTGGNGGSPHLCLEAIKQREGLDIRIDHRSHQERGLELSPTEHVGVHATQMQRQGMSVERARLDAPLAALAAYQPIRATLQSAA